MIHDCQFSKNLNLMNAIIISNGKPLRFLFNKRLNSTKKYSFLSTSIISSRIYSSNFPALTGVVNSCVAFDKIRYLSIYVWNWWTLKYTFIFQVRILKPLTQDWEFWLKPTFQSHGSFYQSSCSHIINELTSAIKSFFLFNIKFC